MFRNLGSYTCRLLAIFVLMFSVATVTANGNMAFADPPADQSNGDSNSDSGGFWDTLWNTTTDTVGSIANSFFTPIGQGADATANTSIGVFDAIGNAFTPDNLSSLISGGILGAITGNYTVPLDFGTSGTGGLVYNSNNDTWGLSVPDGNGGGMTVSSMNDIVSLGLDLGSFGSIGVNNQGGVVNFGPFSFSWGDFFGGLMGGGGFCGQNTAQGLGSVICNSAFAFNGLPQVLSAIAYISAVAMSLMGCLKVIEHVNDPRSVPIWEPIKRFIVGGALFALPYVTNVLANMVGLGIGTVSNTGMAGQIAGTGLDAMLVRLMSDIWTPMLMAVTWFCYCAAIIFTMIGIHRLLRTAQDGPRGPAGIGTIMTFVVAGALFSVDSMMAAFSGSMFNMVAGGANVFTFGALAQTTGDAAVDQHVAATIGVGVAFMVIVGWISFVRGFFIIRGVAEGDQQASLMAGVTHLLGGALAVNIGPVIEAVQSTLGLSGYGLNFN